MIEFHTDLLERTPAPSLVPHSRPIDHQHLFRMTLGDNALEREVLQLFDCQIAILFGRIADGEAGIVAAAAHTLKGSARSIGAWDVDRAACSVEAAALACEQTGGRDPAARARLEKSVTILAAAVAEVRTDIGEILRGH